MRNKGQYNTEPEGAAGAGEPREGQRTDWRRPTLERLKVSLDTAMGGGSHDEGAGRSTPL